MWRKYFPGVDLNFGNPSGGVQLSNIHPIMPACCRDSIPDTQDEQHCGALIAIESCKEADQSSDESFAESNAYGDELDNLTGTSS
jgi:hypothetical protein